jgi:uncharacterized protein
VGANAAELQYPALRHYATEQVSGLVFVSVSGAHLYGFPSPDSDVDLRGTFAAPIKEVLSLNKPKETLEPSGDVGGVEVELVAHEIEKYLRLLVKPNGYVLEQICSPLVVFSTPAYTELKDLAMASLSRNLYYHYSGFAGGEWKEYQKPGITKTVKRLLYIHRVLMTGIVLLREGVVEANLYRLNERFNYELQPLIERKLHETEEFDGDERPYAENIKTLFAELEAAKEKSILPQDAPNREALSDFLIRLRLAKLLSERTG